MRWFRCRSRVFAALTLPPFLSVTLSPMTALAQDRDEPAPLLYGSGEATRQLADQSSPLAASPARDGAHRPGGDPHLGEASPSAGPARQIDTATADPTTTSTEPVPASGGGTGAGAISMNAISLPTGAATSFGMGESFTAQLTTGVGMFSIPLTLPANRGAAQLNVSLVYSSSGGFGVAGAGWSLGGSVFIARQTDRGVPRYDDRADWHPEQDRFIFGGQELVPICTISGDECTGARSGEAMPVWADGWQYFRARVEGSFLRFFWSPDHQTWRIQSKDGAQFELGEPLDGSGYQEAIERNPDEPTEIYRWHVVREYDSHGEPNATPPRPNNLVQFRYLQDGALAYLSDVFYTPPAADPGDPDLTNYAHHVSFRYELRADTQTSFRNGWRLEQRLRLVSADVASKPFEGSVTAPRELVRRYHLGYDPNSHTSLLTEVVLEGRCASPVVENADQAIANTSCPRLPALSLDYTRVGSPLAPLADRQGQVFEPFDPTILRVESSPDRSIDAERTGLVDVNSDGLPDLLVTLPGLYGGKHGVFFNRGVRNGKLTFGAAERMAVTGVDGVDANVLSLHNPNVAPFDVDGDARIDLVHMPTVKKYSVFSPERVGGAWQWTGRSVRTASGQNVKVNFAQDARRTALMDVNGDGLVDVVFSSATEYQTFFALGRYPGGDGQFGHARWTGPASADLSNDPVTSCTPWSGEPARFGDPDVRVADLNGDQLPDVVRIRNGQILYWPGRGNGFWGSGERGTCRGGSFGQDRHLVMENAPRFGTSQPGSLSLADVNGDGFADLVEIRADAVDIYLNENGVAWTDRQTLHDVPFRQNGRNSAQLTDLNGSGSTDILWGEGHEYRYIDLTGGIRPYLLKRIQNGLGRTTELEFTSSTELMVRADVAGQPWDTVMPLSATVMTSSTARDNLEKVGRRAGRYVTSYSYRNPVFDGRQREFRGFRSAETRQIGDANGPTQITRAEHLLGECAVAQNGVDVCSPADRWKDNWREPLKGLPSITEAFDESGAYLSTSHNRYELRQLYTGRDGRRVSVAYGVAQDSLKYDSAPFEPSESTVALPSLDVALVGITQSETAQVPRRAAQGTVRLSKSSTFDDFGNVLTTTTSGCVEGCGAPDEIITTHNSHGRPTGDLSGWLFRPLSNFVTGSVQTARRYEARLEYNAAGDAVRSFTTLSGTLPLDRFHETSGAPIAPPPPQASGGVSSPVEIVSLVSVPDQFGTATSTRAPLGRCRNIELDPEYAQLPIRESVFGGPVGANGCGEREFDVTASYDRGFGLLVTHTSITGQPSRFEFDGFARMVSEFHADPESPGNLSAEPTFVYAYRLPADANITPYSIVVRHGQDGPDRNTPEYLDSFQYLDGLGRVLIALTEADPASGDGGQFIAGGHVEYNAKGVAARAYLNRFWSGDPLAFPLGAAPGTRSTTHQYDAFGRTQFVFGLDGQPNMSARYHAMSVDGSDGEDLAPGPHSGTFGTVRADGHGRQVESIERIRSNGAIEERRILTEYLPTGEPQRVIQRRIGSPDVVRWMRYDTLGRLVLNVEPNASQGFNPDFNTNPSLIKAWRYAYDDLGELVGTSDPRGCGVNYHYDAAGRQVGQDYSPCSTLQAAYTAPNFVTETGLEVLHRYDLPDPETASAVDAAGNRLDVNPALLWGHHVAVLDRGRKVLTAFDALNRVTGSAARVVRPGPAASSLASRFAPRWYVRKATYDAADRPSSMTTGATSEGLLGAGNSSVVTQDYSRRGATKDVRSSYGVLLARQTLDANALLVDRVLGDAAATTRSYRYDEQLRLKSVQSYRAVPTIWSSPPTGYTAPVMAVTGQLLLEDSDIEYDQANNITRITDWRTPEEWPGSAKPVTRTFEYDDLYRLTRTTYSYPNGGDPWVSPFSAENATASRQPQPSPHVSFAQRVLEQRYEYDYLGNTTRTTDDSNGFFDRSLGVVTNGTANAGPNRLVSASNRATGSTRQGSVASSYDAAGDLTDLVVQRDGGCLPQGASCWQRFRYDWDEVGQLARARRYDLVGGERTANDQPAEPLPNRAPNAELRYSYDTAGQRVLKTAVDPNGVERHTLYVFSGAGSLSQLELRRTAFAGTGNTADYLLDSQTETLYLVAGGVTARVVQDATLPAVQNGGQHVFFELSDHLGSTTFLIDRATSELVSYSTYEAYGHTESDYRPSRWGAFRDPYKFSGKEDDVEVGLAYFGSRYLSLGLGRWLSPDPVTIHELHSDINPYAYVKGRPLVATDPNGEIALLLAVAIGVAIGAVLGGTIYSAKNGVHPGSGEWWGGFSASVGMGALAGGLTAAGLGLGLAGAFGATTAAGYAAVGMFAGGLGMAVGTGTAILQGKNGWDIFTRGLETGLTTGIGAMAGYGAGFAGASAWNLLGGSLTYNTAYFIAGFAAINAGINGAFTGARQTYDWKSPTGYIAFSLDSTWGIGGTTLGNALNVINLGAGKYNSDLSWRQNRQVYDGGLQLQSGFDLTLGNVTSHDPANGDDFLDAHETLHIWQNRGFGPTYLLTTVFMGALGLTAGSVYSGVSGKNWWDSVRTIGYYDNPFEAWSYSVEGGGGDDEVPRKELCWWCSH